MIQRQSMKRTVQTALRRSRVVALIGPRQCGKTTLAREFVKPSSLNYFDLENPESLARLSEPMTALKALRGLVVIDEIQHRPDLFALLRVLADRRPLPAKFLILGSAAPNLLRQSSESLAGRIEQVSMEGFSLREVGLRHLGRHWLRGGFPRSFLARSEVDSLAWRRGFIQTLLERDLPQLGVSIPAPTMLRFWTMLAHYNGQVWNASEFARSLGLSEPTVRSYLDILEGVFMVRVLRPWHANLKKRQVKAPKIYFRDTGLLHHLLGIRSRQDLLTHPKSGASWEAYSAEELLKLTTPDEAYFWATHQGAELDLLLSKGGKRIGVEIKRADAPTITPSIRIALEDLQLSKIYVLYPGHQAYALSPQVEVLPWDRLVERSLF